MNLSPSLIITLSLLLAGIYGSIHNECTCIHDGKNRCLCEGGIDTFPTFLYAGRLHSLSFINANITSIHANSLEHYKATLSELSITRMRRLVTIDDGVLQDFQQLNFLTVIQTPLSKLPKMSGLGVHIPMHRIDFENNKIRIIRTNNVRVRTDDMFLNYNAITTIEGWAFNGSEISKLSLKGNKELSDIAVSAFQGLKSLREIDLSDTSLSYLPVLGLEELEILNLENTKTLRTIPSIYDLKNLKKALLTYSFHCCAFQYPAKHNPKRHKVYIEQLNRFCKSVSRRNERDMEEGFGEIVPAFHNSSNLINPSNVDGEVEKKVHHGIFHQISASISYGKNYELCGKITRRKPVDCRPQPNALNPCEDMMSWAWLRISVWIVLSSAIFGNVAVLAVHIFIRSEKNVPRLLMGNLAFADLCMAFYLLLLAIMDLISTETYFNFAYMWQEGYGCRIAGFLTVFASQLSLFTLCVLTIERWFAIRHALYSNIIDIKLAFKIMASGWIYSLTMAILPLCGVSSYSNTSICLPMEIGDKFSLAYVIVLLSMAAFGFGLMCFCYIQIYLSLNYETRTRGEGSIAKKITILVGTNFICWAPIAFFSVTAVAGFPLISVTQSKILLVFFYPLNSCANPFLYAILTRQYRKDIVMLLARHGMCHQCARKYTFVYSRPLSNNNRNTGETQL
ncbi:lutropin-choriogonadotropic hormone receptor-like isoform X2 [Cimex lectularius]|uniref:G-protein coupled receptors family 1 profile domain-containing protein n=1 Tax=Cimex lectularius TaxID=79782 RepID=A0A8I6TLT7_CIMLE|nr:lutropin-choriogonadotropic hormone receptor-like isoform X2 [Cimex lectularius]